jgi:predicted dehydrogenase
MARIGVGIIGLSATGGWASIAHLPYLRQSDKYEIVALTNSSLDSSRQAIKAYGLASADPYDSVAEMAKSARVQLVVCAVAVFSHYNLIKPAILAQKDVYVEWPLGVTTQEAEELDRSADSQVSSRT